jgi:threonine dehydrogenase-like Zn-dependent dehydrogenase
MKLFYPRFDQLLYKLEIKFSFPEREQPLCERLIYSMKAIMYDLKTTNMILRKLKIGNKYIMVKYNDQWPIPEIKYPNQVLIKTSLAGICASDIHQIALDISYYASILAKRTNPFPMGHEVVGEVTKIGSDVKDLRVGDRVIYNPVPHCEAYGFAPCASCKNGNWENCYCLVGIGDGSPLEQQHGGRNAFGGFGGGGFGEYFIGFEKQFYKIPKVSEGGMPDEISVLTEPFAVAMHAVARNMPKDSDTVIVVGAGIIGLMIIAALRSLGSKSRIISLARYSFQADKARKMGADEIISERNPELFYQKIASATNGLSFKPKFGKKIVYGNVGPDVIFDCVATESSMDDDIHLVKSNGKIVVVGLGYTVTKKIDWAIPIYKEIDIVGTMMHGVQKINGETIDSFELALKHMQKNPSLFTGLVTHKFAIENYKEAFECMHSKKTKNTIKIAFDFTH